MVRVACLCDPLAEGVRHPDGDEITLRERLGLHESLVARNAMVAARDDPEAGVPEILATLSETLILLGVEAWTVIDAKGRPVPPSKAELRARLMPNVDAALAVADEADDRYSAAIIRPLVARASRSSQPGPTDASTYPATGSPRPHRKRSKRSSTMSSPTAVIVTTSLSPAGVSS